MDRLETAGVKIHFIRTINETDVLVRKVHILPLEVIIRNIAAGSFSKKYGVPEGKPLKMPLLELSLKVADEITPDTCRLWEKGVGVKMDKDRFRQDLGGVEEAYEEAAKRVIRLSAEDTARK
ncbi:MAG: hypothetical protein LBB94_09840 [Clostridiales bacterium]|jgi:phosphoribosylaminoimidazole-succinocarboxamide synthase|nr:hypothetical protein [Clostridiales bacterium]